MLLLALTATAVIGLLTGAGPGGERSLASQIAFKQRCAVRFPDPCWQDPLTEAYGRGLAGAIGRLLPHRRRWRVSRPSTTGAAGR